VQFQKSIDYKKSVIIFKGKSDHSLDIGEYIIVIHDITQVAFLTINKGFSHNRIRNEHHIGERYFVNYLSFKNLKKLDIL
jgi:hypothetical protein